MNWNLFKRSLRNEVFRDINHLCTSKGSSILFIWKKDHLVLLAMELSREKLQKMRGMLQKILLMEQMSWRQKFRALWHGVSDCNTKCFHRVANLQGILIIRLSWWWTVLQGMKYSMLSFYIYLLSNPRDLMWMLPVFSLWDLDKENIEMPFNEEEYVKVHLESCVDDKAPTPHCTILVWESARHTELQRVMMREEKARASRMKTFFSLKKDLKTIFVTYLW